MWMNDYEYEFKKDSADKKNVARSARSTRTHCGKRGAVKFPSDYMTKKELNAMNGEVINYASLKKAMSFAEFKELPDDLKKRYITWIREKFEAPDKYIAEMMNISYKYLSLYLVELNLNKGAGFGKRNWKKDEFYAWVSGADMDAPVAPVESEPVDILPEEIDTEMEVVEPETPKPFEIVSDSKPSEPVKSEPIKSVVPTTGNLTFEANADMALDTVKALLGNQKVKITVYWDVIKD